MDNEPDMPTVNQSNSSEPSPQHHRPLPPPVRRRSVGSLGLLLVAAVVLLVGGILLFSMMKNNEDSSTGTTTSQKTTDKWFAVFLTNGQVYFGHLPTVEADQLQLANIYYLQVQERVQPPASQQQTEQPGVSLVKLGRSELHCPVDKMTINRDQVLFWEELKPESKVVQAINEYLKTDDSTKACYEGLNQQ